MDEWNGDLLGRTSQNTKVPNPHQPFWQDMQGKSADKLQIVQIYLQFMCSLTVDFVADGGLLLADLQNPMVGDRYFV